MRSSNVMLDPYLMLISLRFCVHNSFSDFKSVVSMLHFLSSDCSQFGGQIYWFWKHGIHCNVLISSILKLICYSDYKLLLLSGCYHWNKVNSEFYMQVVKGYWNRFWEWGHNCKGKAVGSFCTTIPLLILLWFLANRDGKISSPPYLLYLAPSDPLLFPKVETALKGRRLQDVGSKMKVTTKLTF